VEGEGKKEEGKERRKGGKGREERGRTTLRTPVANSWLRH